VKPFSQAIVTQQTVYIAAQQPDPSEDLVAGVSTIVSKLKALCQAAGGELTNIVKLNIYLLDIAQLDTVQEILSQSFAEPSPVLTVLGVNALPANAAIAIDAVMVLSPK
jgi:enamine deaminase RidA (YjgF/YER057c/UK114 family)